MYVRDTTATVDAHADDGSRRATTWQAISASERLLLVVDANLEVRYVNDSAKQVIGFGESAERRSPRPGLHQLVGSRYRQLTDWLKNESQADSLELVLYAREIGRYELFKQSISLSGRSYTLLELVCRQNFVSVVMESLIPAAVFCYSQLPVYITDAEGRISDASVAFLQLVGLKEHQLENYRDVIWYDGVIGPQLPLSVREKAFSAEGWRGDVHWRTVSGRRFRGKLTVTGVAESGDAQNMECSGMFVHHLERVEDEPEEGKPLQSVAELDLNTGMLNRRGFARAFDTSLAEATRVGEPLHVLFVDLDRFPEIDKTHGSAIADKVLTNAALRLKGAVRDSDILARLAPLEFVVVLQNGDVGAVAAKLVELLGKPYGIDGLIVESSASVGIASYPDDGLSAKELMVHADCAKYCCKRDGGNRHRFYVDCDQQLKEIFTPLMS